VSWLGSKTLKVVIEKGEDGYFSAHCPALKRCWSQGRTRDEALRNIREAIDLYSSAGQFAHRCAIFQF